MIFLKYLLCLIGFVITYSCALGLGYFCVNSFSHNKLMGVILSLICLIPMMACALEVYVFLIFLLH